ncbi:MAG TPA: O-antigen ligase family protein [Pyrinomonadaceae bacterium]|nr:O-antigen ligase family protein [Pyrinomonadaceae bacterium]
MTKRRHSDGEETSRISKAVLVFVCLIPMIAAIAYGAVDPWVLGLLSILIATMAVLWLLDAALSGEFRYSSNTLQIPILAMIAIGCIQLLPFGPRSMDPYATRFFLIRLAICSVFFAAALAYIHGVSRRKAVAITIVVFGALIGFFAILQRLAAPDGIYGLRPTPQAIPLGPFVNQHHFAALMEMTSGVALGLLFGTGLARSRKLFVAIAAAIMGMAIMFTGSRGGLISYVAVIAFTAGASLTRRGVDRHEHDVSARLRRNLLVASAAIALVLVVLGSVLFLGGEGSLLRGIGLAYEQSSDVTNGRSHFWSIAWQVFLAHPILGAGYDAFGVAFTRYDTWNGQFRVEQAHNDYLQILADGGVVTFVVVAGFVFLLLKKGVSAIVGAGRDIDRSISTGALAGCFGILIHSFFDFPLRTPANGFFFLLLVVLAVERSSRAARTSGTTNAR